MKEYIQAKQFAAVLALDIKTFDYHCKTKKIPIHDLTAGRTRLWKYETIMEYLLNEKKLVELKIEHLREVRIGE